MIFHAFEVDGRSGWGFEREVACKRGLVDCLKVWLERAVAWLARKLESGAV